MKTTHIAVFAAFTLAGLFAGCKKSELSVKSQSIGMKQLANARELGGIRVADGRTVKRGMLLRSAAPNGASTADLAWLTKTYHLAVIADFRMSFEREQSPTPVLEGVRDEWIPIIDEEAVRQKMAALSAGSGIAAPAKADRATMIRMVVQSGIVGEDMYINFLASEQGKQGYREFFKQLLALPNDRALLFHCTQGKDRTGTGAMLLLSALGADENTIMQDFLLTNACNALRIDQEKADLRALGFADDELETYITVLDGVNGEFMQNALLYLKAEYGSVTGYITNVLGITAEEIDMLKDKFLE